MQPEAGYHWLNLTSIRCRRRSIYEQLPRTDGLPAAAGRGRGGLLAVGQPFQHLIAPRTSDVAAGHGAAIWGCRPWPCLDGWTSPARSVFRADFCSRHMHRNNACAAAVGILCINLNICIGTGRAAHYQLAGEAVERCLMLNTSMLA